MSIAVLPPPITTILRPTGSVDLSARLAQPRDVGDGILDAGQLLAFGLQRIDAGEPHAQEHGIEVAAQLRRA